jgi:hypothetical protein
MRSSLKRIAASIRKPMSTAKNIDAPEPPETTAPEIRPLSSMIIRDE